MMLRIYLDFQRKSRRESRKQRRGTCSPASWKCTSRCWASRTYTMRRRTRYPRRPWVYTHTPCVYKGLVIVSVIIIFRIGGHPPLDEVVSIFISIEGKQEKGNLVSYPLIVWFVQAQELQVIFSSNVIDSLRIMIVSKLESVLLNICHSLYGFKFFFQITVSTSRLLQNTMSL